MYQKNKTLQNNETCLFQIFLQQMSLLIFKILKLKNKILNTTLYITSNSQDLQIKIWLDPDSLPGRKYFKLLVI